MIRMSVQNYAPTVDKSVPTLTWDTATGGASLVSSKPKAVSAVYNPVNSSAIRVAATKCSMRIGARRNWLAVHALPSPIAGLSGSVSPVATAVVNGGARAAVAFL